jgi:ubiquitin-like 1-activating enzyme E1 B
LEDKPIKTLESGEKAKLDIPRRQRSVAGPGTAINGNGHVDAPQTNGVDTTGNKTKAVNSEETNGTIKKRPAPEASEEDVPSAKRSKVVQNGGPSAGNDLIILDDTADGAIVIDDD